MNTHFLVIGGGIIGLSIARELHIKYPDKTVTLIEKESEVALHASGRNSGVLHAGFYYTADSLKAKFCVDGNKSLTKYCLDKNIPINRCGKVVVAKDEGELERLYELEKRGVANGVDVKLVDLDELNDIEPNAKTYQKALYSPTTSTIDPKQVCDVIYNEIKDNVEMLLNTRFKGVEGDSVIQTSRGKIKYNYLINAAGLYADQIAHLYGVGLNYTMIPFKGAYLDYKDDTLLRTHVYPVPNLKNPFLGVHWTIAVDGHHKIGPTSMPAFWRENYQMTENFKCDEFLEVIYREGKQFLFSSLFRSLAFDEIKKYYKPYLCKQASQLVKKIENSKYGSYIKPGIRAQLLDKRSLDLVMDFVVEHENNTTHILNAVSPAFTCAFSFSRYIVENIGHRA
ncbi:L-2-hydroxyglutarate oxidase [bacterium]|nr:L-2-hydroxyglutarate oxidase [bacterium]